MLDTSNNLTLEEINYVEEESISAISEIKYEDDYGFLNESNFDGDHLALSRIRLHPRPANCEIQFFEDGQQTDGKQHPRRENSSNRPIIHRKIGTLTLREDNFLKSSIKLPLARSPIFLRLQSKQNQPLHGRLSNDEGESEIALFDEAGARKGSLNYHMQSKHSPKEAILVEDDTLHSHLFMEEMPLVRKEVQIPIPARGKRMDVANLPTLNNSIAEVRKKRPQSDDEDKRSEKSEIDYLGYENTSKLEERVGEYRLPMHQKKIATEVKTVDYQSLKRSMDDLGLSKHFKIGAILQRSRHHDELKQQIQQDLQSSIQTGTVAQVSFQDFSSQADATRPEMTERGIGTYTPLPSRLNEEISSSPNHHLPRYSRQLKDEGIQYEPATILEEYLPPRDPEPVLRNSHLPRTHFVRSKQVDSSFEVESIAERQSLPKQRRQLLSVRNNVYEVRVGSSRLNSRNGSKKSKGRDWMSCKQSTSNNLDCSESGSESILYPEADIIVNNVSVNFHRKSFGAKLLQLSISPTTYRTESLAGNNLIWIGKEYHFKAVCGSSELNVSLRHAEDEVESTLAQVKIRVSDLILNQKKCYFQTFLLSKKEVVAILIIGFQVAKRDYAVSKQVFPVKVARQTHAQTELSRSKTTKIKRSPRKKLDRIQGKEEGLPSPRLNPIRVRKYQGGKNIKIGRASRFASDSLNVPGPGDYQIESSFSRHAAKDI